MKVKSNIVKIIVVAAYCILVGFLLFNIFRLSDLYNKEEMDMVMDVEEQIKMAVSSGSDESMEEILDAARQEYLFEVVITRDEDIVYASIPYEYGDALIGRGHPDAIARESQGPYHDGSDSLFVWYSVYRLTDSAFVHSFLNLVLIIVGLVTALIVLTVYVISRSLFDPLLSIKESLEYAKNYQFNKIEENADVITQSFKDFTVGLEQNISAVSRQHTELETQLQANREYLKQMLLVSKSMVHDLKTPLHGTVLESDLLLSKDCTVSELEAFVSKTNKSTHQTLLDINRILELLNEENHLARKIKEFDTVHAMMRIIRTFNKQLLDKNLYLDFVAPDSAIIETDEVVFTLLINNILSNILNYSQHESDIGVYIDQNKEEIVMRFTNTASYADIDRLKNSEQLFNKVKNNNEDYIYSSGNGLYLIKELSNVLNAQYELNIEQKDVEISLRFRHEEEK